MRTSAATASRWSAPPPSSVIEIFGAMSAEKAAAASARRSSAAMALVSNASSGSSPERALLETAGAWQNGPSNSADRRRQLSRRGFGQSADLNASARGNLDDSVPTAVSGGAQGRECRARNRRAGRRDPREQPVPGRHWLRKTGATAASQRSIHGALPPVSADSLISTSLRRGCQSPRRRAASKRAATAAAAAGFSRTRKSRTISSAT